MTFSGVISTGWVSHDGKRPPAFLVASAVAVTLAALIPVVYLICNNASYRVLKINMNLYKEAILGQTNRPHQYQNMDFPVPFDWG